MAKEFIVLNITQANNTQEFQVAELQANKVQIVTEGVDFASGIIQIWGLAPDYDENGDITYENARPVQFQTRDSSNELIPLTFNGEQISESFTYISRLTKIRIIGVGITNPAVTIKVKFLRA